MLLATPLRAGPGYVSSFVTTKVSSGLRIGDKRSANCGGKRWGGGMNIISFPDRKRPATCPICETWPNRQRERLLIDDIPLKKNVCDDCLLVFWEHLMATEPTPARR